MATEVVSFRVDGEAVKALKLKGINPNAFAKEAFEGHLRRMKLGDALQWFQRHPAPALGEPVEKAIRRLRDER